MSSKKVTGKKSLKLGGDDEKNDPTPSLWKMPTFSASIPSISVNEREVKLDDLDPDPPVSSGRSALSSETQSVTSDRSTTITQTSTNTTKTTRSSSSDDNSYEKLIREQKDDDQDGDGIHHHLKLWRRKLLILVWLNFIQRCRGTFLTLVEVVLPTLLLGILIGGAIVNGKIKNPFGDDEASRNKPVAEDDPFHPHQIMNKDVLLQYTCSNNDICDFRTRDSDRNFFIAYSPNTSWVNGLMEEVTKILYLKGNPESSKLIGFETPREVAAACEEQYKKNDNHNKFPYGLVFNLDHDNFYGETAKKFLYNVPTRLDYTIRTFFEDVSITTENFPLLERVEKVVTKHHVSPYIYSGMAGMQYALDLAYVRQVKTALIEAGVTKPLNSAQINYLYKNYENAMSLRKFKYPFFLDHDVKYRSWAVIVLAFILSYIPTNFCSVQEIVYQAQHGSTELLKFHGLTAALHFLSHGIISAIFRVVSCIGMTTLLFYCFHDGSSLPYPHPTILWLFLFNHAMAEHFENIFFSHFFTNPTLGGMMTIVKSVASFLVPMSLYGSGDTSRAPNVFFGFLATQWCFANGMYSYLQYELYDEGLEWFDFPVMINTKKYVIIPLQACCMIFVYSGAIFITLSVYLDAVFARTYSPGLGWLFIFRKYFRKRPEYKKPSAPINYEQSPNLFERPFSDTICTVRVRNLSRITQTDISYNITVDNVNLDICEGEITAIVGKSGSGKSDLLNMICGLLEPTSGFVEMKNLKVSEYSVFLSQFISVMPQNDMLFDTLSVDDHVRLACMLHGISYQKSKAQTKMLLQLFNLTGAKRHSHLHLSSTHKKKLAMAMALASHPSFLVLDEPTNGMDVETVKQFWRNLQLLKPKRTIIVATSRMEDVELYCDRMALMAKGKVLAYATPGRIKRVYNIGSTLNLKEEGIEVNLKRVESIIHSEVKGAIKLSPMGFEPLQCTYRYLLPYGESYAALLEKLEDESGSLYYSKFWISRAELSTVFFKISLSKGMESVLATKETFIKKDTSKETVEVNIEKPLKVERPELRPNQATNFTALFQRKWRHIMQKRSFFLNDFVIPVILMILAVLMSKHFLKLNPESLSLPLKINMYNETMTYIKTSGTTTNQDLWYNAFKETLGGTPTEKVSSNTVMHHVFQQHQAHSLTNFKKQAIVAFEHDDSRVIGYYSENAYHSCPIAMNIITNSFLFVLTGDKTFQVGITNHPIAPYNGFTAGSTQNNATTMFAFLVSIFLALIAGAELGLPLIEKQNHTKRLLSMSGVHPAVYWSSHALGDFLINGLVTLVLVIVTRICDIDDLVTGWTEETILALIIFGYLCWSSLPFSYIISNLIETKHDGYGHFLVIHFFLGICPKAIVHQFWRRDLGETMKWVRYCMLMLPPYSVTSALVNYFQTVADRSFCDNTAFEQHCLDYRAFKKKEFLSYTQREELDWKIDHDMLFRSCCEDFCKPQGICHDKPKPDFIVESRIPGLWEDLLSMAVQGVFYWLIIILMERRIPQDIWHWFTSRLCGSKEKKSAEDDVRDFDEPEDVKKEHQKVDYMVEIEDNVDSELFLVQDVTKFYKTSKCIDHAYFSTPVNQTTGILGLPKCGFTTLIKLLTTDFNPSSGSIYMGNELVVHGNKDSCAKKMGYCPQMNAMFPYLTGAQCLHTMGKVRGISDSEIDIHVHHWLDNFDLQDYSSQRCITYRPGVVRRLCCAMAVIGQPKVLLFDQPTLNMDLEENHSFWKAIKTAKESGQTVIFTSTNTAEVQQCSNKTIILDQGAIVAVGNVQDVIKTNARGFILSLRCRAQALKKLNAYQLGAKLDQLRDHIIRHLSPCELILDDGNILLYSLKDGTVKLSYTYGIMEGAREKFPNLIDNFLVTEPSLDEIVLGFHKNNQTRGSQQMNDHEDERTENERAHSPSASPQSHSKPTSFSNT